MILLHKPSVTAKLLAKEGQISLFSSDIQSTDVLIRWGNTQTVSTAYQRELNSKEAIRLASNKPKARQVLAVNDLPVPIATETSFPVIGRKAYHSGGSGFFVCHTTKEVAKAKEAGAMYFSAFYDKQEEYRIHIAGGKTLLVSIKEGNKDKMIWNHRMNHFQLRHLHRSTWLEDEFLHRMVNVAKYAVRALELSFGAVEIGVNKDLDQQMAIFEVNTAPALSPLARQKYIDYFYTVKNNLEESRQL